MAQPAPIHVVLGNMATVFTDAAASFQAAKSAAQAEDAAAPAWAKKMEADLKKTMEEAMERVEGEVKKLRGELVPYRAAAARSHNKGIINDDEALLEVPATNGEVPPDFPKTRGAVKALTGQQLKNLLEAYGVNEIMRETQGRRMQLGPVIGIKQA
eukprot:XP_001699342.1 hypothetical protein CHLREDRAFT_205586 [Chlamydomonas reinhardtii]